MGVKEKINIEIDRMARNELELLYEQIKLIKRMKELGKKDRAPITIEELRKRTSSSKDSWAEDVIKNREDKDTFGCRDTRLTKLARGKNFKIL